jgi:hypothetical protein
LCHLCGVLCHHICSMLEKLGSGEKWVRANWSIYSRSCSFEFLSLDVLIDVDERRIEYCNAQNAVLESKMFDVRAAAGLMTQCITEMAQADS